MLKIGVPIIPIDILATCFLALPDEGLRNLRYGFAHKVSMWRAIVGTLEARK